MLKVGVIGVGHLGRIHAKLWKENEAAELVGVYDLNADRCRDIAREFSVMPFDDLDSLFAAVDAVSIVTPTSTHGELACIALEHGLHCFIEKPIASDYAEAQSVMQAAERHGNVVQVGHVERFNPAFLGLDGRDLHPMFIESHRLAQFTPRATDVAVVLDLMIHDIDLTLKLVDSPVAEIRASGVAVVSDTIDIANARLEFRNGCVANLTASRISQKQMRKMRLFQRDAYISIDFAKPAVEIFNITDAVAGGVPDPTLLLGAIELGTKKRSIYYEQLNLPTVNAIGMEQEEFVTAIRDGSPPPVTAQEGANALMIAEQIVARIETGLRNALEQTEHSDSLV